MPAVTRWYIKTGLAYFVVALLLGVMLAAPAVAPVPPAILQWVAGILFVINTWARVKEH